MNRYSAAMVVVCIVCVCATVLCALGQLPSEAATAILGGAVVQVVGLVRERRAAGAGGSIAPPSSPGSMGGTIVGMLGGGLVGHVLGLL